MQNTTKRYEQVIAHSENGFLHGVYLFKTDTAFENFLKQICKKHNARYTIGDWAILEELSLYGVTLDVSSFQVYEEAQ